MKYLVLLLALFMVSNVNANVTNMDPEKVIRMCKYGLFPMDWPLRLKSDICYLAYAYKKDEFDRTDDHKTFLAATDLLVKSCNYSRTEYQNKVCNSLISIYNENCMNCGRYYENCPVVPELCVTINRLR